VSVRSAHAVARSRRVLTLAVLLCAVATAAQAHDTWLLPANLRVPVGREVRMGLTSGMAFPADDFAILPARVKRADVRLGGATRSLPAPRSGALALVYRWVPRTPGVATVAVSLAPRALTLRGALIEEYLAEIDASPAIRAEWTGSAPWREVYTKHAKTFVRVDAATPPADAPDSSGRDTSWAQPCGLDLELIPALDPTRLRAGDSLPVRVLYRGRPLADFAVGAEAESGRAPVAFARTDGAGVARVALPVAGRWLLKGTQLRRVHERDVDWRSDFTTLTIAVAPR
jgi:hypothetical protein